MAVCWPWASGSGGGRGNESPHSWTSPAVSACICQARALLAEPRGVLAVASLHGFEGMQPTLAELTCLQLEELGQSAGLVNLDLREPWDKDYRPRDMIAAGIVATPQGSQLLDATSPDADLKAYAYAHGNGIRIILANLAAQPKSVRLTGAMESKGFALASFDQNGELLRQRRITNNRETLNILPGGVLVLEK